MDFLDASFPNIFKFNSTCFHALSKNSRMTAALYVRQKQRAVIEFPCCENEAD